jgi:hypothetical protein
MTGRDGKIRDFSVAPGQMRQELIEEQNRIAEELFCPQFLALWRATKDPFAQHDPGPKFLRCEQFSVHQPPAVCPKKEVPNRTVLRCGANTEHQIRPVHPIHVLHTLESTDP